MHLRPAVIPAPEKSKAAEITSGGVCPRQYWESFQKLEPQVGGRGGGYSLNTFFEKNIL